MEGLLAGDDAAVRALYARFGRPVYTMGLRLLGTRRGGGGADPGRVPDRVAEGGPVRPVARTPLDLADDDRPQPRRGPAPPRDRRDAADAGPGRRGARRPRASDEEALADRARRGRPGASRRSPTPRRRLHRARLLPRDDGARDRRDRRHPARHGEDAPAGCADQGPQGQRARRTRRELRRRPRAVCPSTRSAWAGRDGAVHRPSTSLRCAACRKEARDLDARRRRRWRARLAPVGAAARARGAIVAAVGDAAGTVRAAPRPEVAPPHRGARSPCSRPRSRSRVSDWGAVVAGRATPDRTQARPPPRRCGGAFAAVRGIVRSAGSDGADMRGLLGVLATDDAGGDGTAVVMAPLDPTRPSSW